MKNKIGGALSLLLRVLFIGLCNDRLFQLETLVQLHLLHIDINEGQNHVLDINTKKKRSDPVGTLDITQGYFNEIFLVLSIPTWIYNRQLNFLEKN